MAGRFHSEAIKKLISLARMGFKQTVKTKKRMSRAKTKIMLFSETLKNIL